MTDNKDIILSSPPQMLTIKETAERTGLSYDFIRKLCLRRKIIFIRSGAKYLVNYDRFIDFLNAGDMHNETDN